MVNTFELYVSDKNDPYENLAIEEYLMEEVRVSKKKFLYIWQNRESVVIGKNQNVYNECDPEYLNRESILLVRRTTGGGAVFHDLGNLNYSIILPKDEYDIRKSTDSIVKALNRLGIDAYANGRNDICVHNKKISGNAYFSNNYVGLHHGTILYEVNFQKMMKALSVNRDKLLRHGVRSVQSRVTDICSNYPDINMTMVKRSIIETFGILYEAEIREDILLDYQVIEQKKCKFGSNEWIYGKSNDEDVCVKKSFDYGTVEMVFFLDRGNICDFEIYTDCLEIEIVENIKNKIKDLLTDEVTDPYIFRDEFESFIKTYHEYSRMINDFESLFFLLIEKVKG